MKVRLSLRVRPDCEVAAWVYDEIKLLEAENATLKAAFKVIETVRGYRCQDYTGVKMALDRACEIIEGHQPVTAITACRDSEEKES